MRITLAAMHQVFLVCVSSKTVYGPVLTNLRKTRTEKQSLEWHGFVVPTARQPTVWLAFFADRLLFCSEFLCILSVT